MEREILTVEQPAEFLQLSKRSAYKLLEEKVKSQGERS